MVTARRGRWLEWMVVNGGRHSPAAILLARAVAVVAAAYVAGGRHDVDGTTESAARVVLAAGLLAGEIGQAAERHCCELDPDCDVDRIAKVTPAS